MSRRRSASHDAGQGAVLAHGLRRRSRTGGMKTAAARRAEHRRQHRRERAPVEPDQAEQDARREGRGQPEHAQQRGQAFCRVHSCVSSRQAMTGVDELRFDLAESQAGLAGVAPRATDRFPVGAGSDGGGKFRAGGAWRHCGARPGRWRRSRPPPPRAPTARRRDGPAASRLRHHRVKAPPSMRRPCSRRRRKSSWRRRRCSVRKCIGRERSRRGSRTDWPRTRRTGRRTRSDDRQALAALAAAGGQHLATAFGGHAGAETDVARALFAVGAECGLHELVEKRGSR